MPYMYILECADGSYYIGSTWNLEKRLWEHQKGMGANHTKKRLPVKLVYCEPFDRVEDAFQREKQVQGWSRRKKHALIENNTENLVTFSKNYAQHGRPEQQITPLSEPVEGNTSSLTPASTSSASVVPLPEPVEGSIPPLAPASTSSAYAPSSLPEPVEGSIPPLAPASTSSAYAPSSLPEPVEGNSIKHNY